MHLSVTAGVLQCAQRTATQQRELKE